MKGRLAGECDRPDVLKNAAHPSDWQRRKEEEGNEEKTQRGGKRRGWKVRNGEERKRGEERRGEEIEDHCLN